MNLAYNDVVCGNSEVYYVAIHMGIKKSEKM